MVNWWRWPRWLHLANHNPQTIRGCPAPLLLPQAGHFVQEHGELVAAAALAAFGEP